VVLLYVYSPAERNFANLGRVVDRLAALYLNVDPNIETRVQTSTGLRSNLVVSNTNSTVSPYTPAAISWLNSNVFFALTVFTWLLLVSSLICWIILAVTFFRSGVASSEMPLFLIWAFTAAAGAQIVASIAADFAGALGGNLQLRLFPVFTLFSVPLVVTTISRYRLPRRSKLLRNVTTILAGVSALILPMVLPLFTLVAFPAFLLILWIVLSWDRSRFARSVAAVSCAALVGYFLVAAFLKATSDPMVSNNWTFFSTAERRGIRWSDANLAEQLVWADYDDRFNVASLLSGSDDVIYGVRALWSTTQGDGVRYVLVSPTIQERSRRLHRIVPGTSDADRIYDNGSVRVFHRLPQTPYQP